MNLPILIRTAQVWTEIFDYAAAGGPRTPPLQSLTAEVLHMESKKQQCNCIVFFFNLIELVCPWTGQKVLEIDGSANHKSGHPCGCLGSSQIDESHSTIPSLGQGTPRT